jgi:hypothetical protein
VAPLRNLSGRVFARLTVLKLSTTMPVRYECKCECGRITVVNASALRSGGTRSCGCLKAEVLSDRLTTHGGTQRSAHGRKRERLYVIFDGMRQRTKNPKNKDYPYYGGKGIFICAEWDASYAAFREWSLSNGYVEGEGLTIERIAVDGPYSPENCCWVPMSQQASNKTTRRPVVRISDGAIFPSIVMASKVAGVNRSRIADVLSGIQKSTHGEQWRYATPEEQAACEATARAR